LQFKWRPSGSSLKRPAGAKDRNKQFFNYFINERLSYSPALINAAEREISYRLISSFNASFINIYFEKGSKINDADERG